MHCIVGKLSATKVSGAQVLVDISTPAAVFERVEKAVTAHFKAYPKEYTGQKMVVANNATDPLKYTLCVFWEYNHSGQQADGMNARWHAVLLRPSGQGS